MQIESQKVEVYKNLGRYFFVTLTHGKHSASFAFKPAGVQIMVHNAANRAWKGMGKEFATVEKAVANYKNESIQAMILEASRLNEAAK